MPNPKDWALQRLTWQQLKTTQQTQRQKGLWAGYHSTLQHAHLPSPASTGYLVTQSGDSLCPMNREALEALYGQGPHMFRVGFHHYAKTGLSAQSENNR